MLEVCSHFTFGSSYVTSIPTQLGWAWRVWIPWPSPIRKET